MANAAMFMAPIGPMARKKRVNEKYCPNSYRVISTDAETIDHPAVFSSYTQHDPSKNMLGQSVESHFIDEHRQNRPNPTSVGFLRQDVRLLNEPLCHVRTRDTAADQNQWWPSRANETSAKTPTHTLDTTVRGDFQYRGKGKSGNGRHSSNPNTRPALGSVPVNFLRETDGEQRVWKEGISYEHQYNCRTEPQYPIRAKRHGAFVWDRFSKSEVARMVDHYGITKNTENPASTRASPTIMRPEADMSGPISAPPHSAFWGEDNLQQQSPIKKGLSATPVLPPIGY